MTKHQFDAIYKARKTIYSVLDSENLSDAQATALREAARDLRWVMDCAFMLKQLPHLETADAT